MSGYKIQHCVAEYRTWTQWRTLVLAAALRFGDTAVTWERCNFGYKVRCWMDSPPGSAMPPTPGTRSVGSAHDERTRSPE